jgi:hypothetical protein
MRKRRWQFRLELRFFAFSLTQKIFGISVNSLEKQKFHEGLYAGFAKIILAKYADCLLRRGVRNVTSNCLLGKNSIHCSYIGDFHYRVANFLSTSKQKNTTINRWVRIILHSRIALHP